MDVSEYLYVAYYVVAMFAAAMVSKALGAAIVFSFALSLTYPDVTKASFLFLFFLPAILVASFRD